MGNEMGNEMNSYSQLMSVNLLKEAHIFCIIEYKIFLIAFSTLVQCNLYSYFPFPEQGAVPVYGYKLEFYYVEGQASSIRKRTFFLDVMARGLLQG